MMFRSVVSAMVVVAIASAAVITVPSYTTTPFDFEPMTDTTNPTVNLTTVKPAVKNTTVKPAAPAPSQALMLSCYCNLPECLAAAGGDGTCSTRLGCFSEVQPIIPGIQEEILTPAVTESNNTANGSSVSPIIPELVEFGKTPVVATTEHVTTIRGSFGCLDQLNFAKQTCDEILKSMEAEASEFPIIQVPTNGAVPSATNAGVHAFHCCQAQRCNGNQSGPAEGSVKSAQAVLVAELKNTVASQVIHTGVQNSTVGVPWTPTVKSSVNKVQLSNTESSVNNVQLSNAKKTNVETPDVWQSFFSLEEPNVLQSDTGPRDASSIDATTPAIPAKMPPIVPVAVPANQEIAHDKTVGKAGYVVTKRHIEDEQGM